MVRRRGNDDAPPDRAALSAERVRLLARVREIDTLLGPARERAVIEPPEKR